MTRKILRPAWWGAALTLLIGSGAVLAHTQVSTTFDVRVIHCASCEKRIEREIGQLEGVSMVSASAKDQCVVVAYDPSVVDANRLLAEFERLGFEAALATDKEEEDRP